MMVPFPFCMDAQETLSHTNKYISQLMSSGSAASERAVSAQISRVQEDIKKVEAIQRRLKEDEIKLRALIALEEQSQDSSSSAPFRLNALDTAGNIQES
jgi:flagellar biosynthesis chaperone FliJ